jgi:hypothetical protein
VTQALTQRNRDFEQGWRALIAAILLHACRDAAGGDFAARSWLLGDGSLYCDALGLDDLNLRRWVGQGYKLSRRQRVEQDLVR